jgi:hypothetical protein
MRDTNGGRRESIYTRILLLRHWSQQPAFLWRKLHETFIQEESTGVLSSGESNLLLSKG